MREIIYRGLRKDGRGWAYGSYIYNPRDEEHYIGAYEPPKNPLRGLEWNVYEVDSETVGQFTGRIDDKETKVFDGDILLGTWNEMVDDYHSKDFSDTGFVSWDVDWGKWVVEDTVETRDLYDWCEEIKVIGNRWDSPELLEGAS